MANGFQYVDYGFNTSRSEPREPDYIPPNFRGYRPTDIYSPRSQGVSPMERISGSMVRRIISNKVRGLFAKEAPTAAIPVTSSSAPVTIAETGGTGLAEKLAPAAAKRRHTQLVWGT